MPVDKVVGTKQMTGTTLKTITISFLTGSPDVYQFDWKLQKIYVLLSVDDLKSYPINHCLLYRPTAGIMAYADELQQHKAHNRSV